jgi:hypothetical protein
MQQPRGRGVRAAGYRYGIHGIYVTGVVDA